MDAARMDAVEQPPALGLSLRPRAQHVVVRGTLKGTDVKGGSMPEEFEGDLAGAVFWGADLSGARFRDVNLTDAKISHAWLVNVDIDALVDTVVINGVDVTAYVNERDPWYPLRAMLRPSTRRACAQRGRHSKTSGRRRSPGR